MQGAPRIASCGVVVHIERSHRTYRKEGELKKLHGTAPSSGPVGDVWEACGRRESGSRGGGAVERGKVEGRLRRFSLARGSGDRASTFHPAQCPQIERVSRGRSGLERAHLPPRWHTRQATDCGRWAGNYAGHLASSCVIGGGIRDVVGREARRG